MRLSFSASEIFTGEVWLRDHVIVTKNGMIETVSELGSQSDDLKIENFQGCIIIPAFIDLQVYGAAKKLLAQYPDAETLHVMKEEFLKTGTVLFLPAVASNTTSTVKKCIDAVREYKRTNGGAVPGLHLEGPWFNENKRGAHVKEWIHPPELKEVQDLLDYGKEMISMITLAPEVCRPGIIELITSYNITVAAGHSEATFAQATAGFDSGISVVTHLYNAMSPLHHRAPGLVGAAFKDERVNVSIIPDGHHVAFEAVAIAKKIIGERLYAITDAVTETGEGPYQHYLSGDKYECNGILSGSALTMYQAFLNLVQKVGLSIEESVRMCSLYPAMVIGCGDRFGKIAPHYTGQFLVINKQLELVRVITSK